MRVLHITSGNLFGGVETLLTTLARYRGVCPEMEPEFAVCFSGRLSEELSTDEARVHLLGNVRVRNVISVWRVQKRLAELLRERHFDLAVCHMPWVQAIFGPIVHSAKVPLVSWFHNAADRLHWVDVWARIAVLPNLIICNSSFTRATLPRNLSKIPTHVIYYPVPQPSISLDEDERRSIRAELQTGTDTVVIIQISRMEAWKGHLLNLKALSTLKEIPNWICWQVGGFQRRREMKYFASLVAEADRLGIANRLRFLGERTDVARLLRAADLFCQTNLIAEPFGIVFIEALFASLPVITIASGGALEIINDSCGFLVSPDVKAVAKAERLLIVDDALRATLGGAGPKRAKMLCAVDKQINKLAAILRSVIRRT
jgi:glycosyltransferase involved in cell wall biosynthesis